MSERADEFDVVVIGGGSGGYAAARKAAGYDLRVAVIEGAKELGGLCILRGCMPTKALLETSNRMRAIEEAGEFGIEVGRASVDIDTLRDRKSKLIDGFQSYRIKGLETGPFELIRSHAHFVDPHTVETDDGRRVRGRTFVIATGSEEKLPPVAGLDSTPFWTSDEIVEMPGVPKEVIVMGTGAVGMESAFLFQGLGSKVTIISRSHPLVSGVEPEISEALEKRCADLGIEIAFGSGAAEVNYDADRFTVSLQDGRILTCDQLVVATGRAPRLDGLDLSNAGFEPELKRIPIDAHCQSPVPHIFAVGDCASPYAVVHLAVLQGEAAGKNIAQFLKEAPLEAEWEDRLRMIGIFTDPEVVQVGLTEAEAKEAGFHAIAADYPFNEQGKGEIVGDKHGLVKLVIDANTREILGAGGMGPHVIDYTHTIMVALHQRLTLDEFIRIPSYHPTLGEIWTYVAEEFD